MTEEEKRQRLISLGFDPNTFEYEDENVTRTPTVKPLAKSLNTSSSGAFSRSFARGALPSLAAGAATFGIGSLLDLTGIGAPVGIPIQIAGAGLAAYGARKLQDVIAPNIIPGYTESEQQDIEERPLASGAGNILSTVAGGLSPSLSNLPRAAKAIRALTTGVKPAQSEIQNLLNVGLGATIPPAQQTAVSLAQGQGVPNLQDLLLSAGGGALFSQPNIIGRKLFGWEPNLPSAQQFSADEAAKTQLAGKGTPLGVLAKPLEDISAEAANIRATQEKQQAQLDELTELTSETGKFPEKKPGPAQVIPGFGGFETQFKAAMDKKVAERKLAQKIAKAEEKSQLEAERIAKEVKLPIKEEAAKLGEFPPTKVPQPEPAPIIPTEEAPLTLPKGEEFEPQTIIPASKIPVAKAEITAPKELLKMQQAGKPLTANQLRIIQESLQKSLTEGQIPSGETKSTSSITELSNIIAKKGELLNRGRVAYETLFKLIGEGKGPGNPEYDAAQLEMQNVSRETENLRRSLQQPSPEITKEAQLKGYTTTPTLGWHNIFQKLGLVRGTKVDTQGLITDQVTGKPISGEAYLRTGINQAAAKISTSKAGLDTWPHELFHIFYHDLLASDSTQDNKVAQDGDLAARTSKEYLTAKASDPSLTPHEFLTKKVGADVVRRVFKTDNNGKLANWFKDFWSYIKTRWASNRATSEDYTRLFSNRLLYDRPFKETTIDTGKQAVGARSLQSQEPEITPEIKPERTPAEMLEGPVAPNEDILRHAMDVRGMEQALKKAKLVGKIDNAGDFKRNFNIDAEDWNDGFKKLEEKFNAPFYRVEQHSGSIYVYDDRPIKTLEQQSPEITPLKPLTQKDAENARKASEVNILPNTIPEQRIEREWHLGKLRPEIEKIKQQGESGKLVGDSMDNFYENYRENIGKYVTTPIRALKDELGINIKSSLQSYLTQDSTAAQHVRDYLWDIEDKGKSNIQLTPQEQEGVNTIQSYLKSVRDEQNSRPVLRKGGYNPDYIPFIADRDAVNNVVNHPNTPKAQSLIKDFIDYQQGKGKSKQEVLDQLKTFRAGYAKEQPNIAKQFGPIDKAAGVGIPRSWREKNLVDTLARYGNRVARRFAYHDNMEANPAFEDALINPNTGVAGNESVKAVLRDIAGIRPTAELARTAALGLVKAGIFGPLTGVRNFAQNFTLGLEHSGSPALATKAFVDSWQNMKQNLADSFASGVNRENISSLEFGDEGNTNIISILRRVRDIASDIQGRNILERITRATTYGQGKFLTMHYLEEANQRGNFSKDGAQFFKNFGQGIDITPTKQSFTPVELSKIASRLTENIQGKYDYRGLPQIAVEGTLAPFLALSRWSIERSNNFMKYVVSPALNGNYKPFLLSTLGMVLGGEAVNAITQLATGKKEKTASFKELGEASAEGKNITPDIFYKMASLSAVSGYAGILGDLAKAAADKLYGKVKPQSYNNALVEFASNTAETGADLIDAIKEGGISTDSMTEFVNKLLTDHIQTYRVLLAHLGPETKENIDRINKLRDLRTFNTLDGDKITDLSDITQANPLREVETKKFKREQDIGKALEILPSLIQDAIEKSKGNPEKLKEELRSIKENQYPTLPNPKTLPFSFLNYIKFLQNTQGNEEASKRLTDYLMRNAINKEKSQLVPSI